MKSNSQWLGNQIKSYVSNNLPSWSNFPNNPLSKTAKSTSTSTKPPLSIDFISVSDYEVEPENATSFFTVKDIYST